MRIARGGLAIRLAGWIEVIPAPFASGLSQLLISVFRRRLPVLSLILGPQATVWMAHGGLPHTPEPGAGLRAAPIDAKAMSRKRISASFTL